MRDVIKSSILELIGNGIKGVELTTKVIVDLINKRGQHPDDIEPEEILECLEELVSNNQLIEINFEVPDHPYRVKSFYLPKDSKVLNIRGI